MKVRHPIDLLARKPFYYRYIDFSSDPHNVKLQLANDRFKAHGNMSTGHGTSHSNSIQSFSLDVHEIILFLVIFTNT